MRPSYPADLFDALLQMLPVQPKIVEVGTGTGQATKDLLARGASVFAIEIGPAMAAKLRSNLPSDRLRIGVGDFEVFEVGAGEADAVFSATAYHWISPEAQTDRPAAILRPGGLMAIVDPNPSRLTRRCGLLRRCPADLRAIWTRSHRTPGSDSWKRRSDDPLSARRRSSFQNSVAVRRYDWDQTYSAKDYRTLMLSYSGTQMMKETDRLGLLDDVESLHTERLRRCRHKTAGRFAYNCKTHPALILRRCQRTPGQQRFSPVADRHYRRGRAWNTSQRERPIGRRLPTCGGVERAEERSSCRWWSH